MKQTLSALSVAMAIASTPTFAEEADSVAKAQSAATQWMKLIDAGEYAQSWNQAATAFQAAITKDKWAEAVQAVRPQLGTIKSRKLKSAEFTKSLPGAPDGEYVVIQYSSQFEKKGSAIETVVPLRDKDGSWRVVGYTIN